MTTEQWWKQEPPEIVMTDARARALLADPKLAKNNDEWIFVQANASTMIPPKKIKIIGLTESLGLHKPNDKAPLVYGEE